MKTCPQVERITAYLQDTFGSNPEHLWTRYPNYSVFRHPASRKWFAALLDVPRSKLGLDGDEIADILDIKCSPLMIGSLLSEPGFLPAYHMNKNTWITILLDESVPDEKIFPLLELSYDASAPKQRKKVSN